MALITCSECGKQISDKAEVCPNCGNPNREVSKKNIQKEPEKIYIQTEKKSSGGVWAIVGVLIVIVLIIIIIGSL